MTAPEDVVRAFYRALNDRDFRAATAVVADGCTWTSMASRARERGPAPIVKGLLEWTEGFPDVRFEILELIASGPRVVVEWRVVGTHLGPFRGQGPTNRRIDRRGCTVVEVEDGRFAAVRDYYDRRTLDEQLRA